MLPELELLVLQPALPMYGLLLLLDDVVLAVHVALRLNNALEFFRVFKGKAVYCFLESDLRIDLGLLEMKVGRRSEKLKLPLHGVLFLHQVPMRHLSQVRITLHERLFETCPKESQVIFVLGLHRSFKVRLEDVQLISTHDLAHIRRDMLTAICCWSRPGSGRSSD